MLSLGNKQKIVSSNIIFEYFIANGLIDYLFFCLFFVYYAFFNITVYNPPANYQPQNVNILYVLFVFLVAFILLLTTLILWPVVDIAFIYYFPQYIVIFLIYLLIRLVILIFRYQAVYNFAHTMIFLKFSSKNGKRIIDSFKGIIHH